MDFKTPARVIPLLEQIDYFYTSEVQPREEALQHRLSNRDAYLDTDGHIHPEIQQARREIMAASGQAGLYSLHLPEHIGGGGLSRTEMFFVEEKVYGYGVGLNPAILSWTDGATPRLLFCPDQQREQFVDPLVRGEKTSCNAVTELNAGSNFFDFTTRAEKRGDQWVLNGHKAFITNAFEADIANVFVMTDPGQGRKSFSYFQFDTKAVLGRGYRTGQLYQTMFDDGLTGELFCEDLVLPADALIGERGQGFDIAMTSINWTRMRRAGMCSGWGKYLVDKTIERASTRTVGGKPLGSNQGIQWMVADMYVDWKQARALSLACLSEIDEHIDYTGLWWKTPQPKDQIRNISMIKLANDEAFYRIADKALQIHGGAGIMKNSEINKLFQIARNLRIPGGADEVQRSTIAETLGLQAWP